MTSTVLGYRTERTLTPYPFKDTAQLKSKAFPYLVFPNDIILDTVITVDREDVTHACLETFSLNSSGDAFIRIQLFNSDKELPAEQSEAYVIEGTVTYAVMAESSDLGRAILTNDEVVVRLQFGTGLAQLFSTGIPVSYVFDTFLTSDNPTAQFLDSCIEYQVPTFKTLECYNLTGNISNVPSLIGTVDLGNGEIITCNSNFKLQALNKSSLALDVIGSNDYLGCEAINGRVTSINGISADRFGNFRLNSDSCYTMTPGTASLTMVHNCDPKCSETHISSFVHYWNRVKDATKQLASYGSTGVGSVQNILLTQMENYKTKMASLLRTKAPFIEAQYARSMVASKHFVSLAVGIFDPNRQDLTVNFAVKPEAGVTWTYQPSTAFLKEGNNLFPLAFGSATNSWKFTDRAVNCRGSAITEFVLSTASNIDNKTLGFQLMQGGAAKPSSSFTLLNVKPTGVHFNVRSKRIWNATTGKYDYTLSIELMDAAFDPDAPTKATNLSINLGGTLTLVPDSVKLLLNNGSTVTSLGNGLSYTSLGINYSQKATVTLSATFTPSGGNDATAEFSLPITLSHTTDSYTKTVTLK